MLLILLTWLSGFPVPLMKKVIYWTLCYPRGWMCASQKYPTCASLIIFMCSSLSLCTALWIRQVLNALIAPTFSVAFVYCGIMNSSWKALRTFRTFFIQPVLIFWSLLLNSGLCMQSHYKGHGWMNIHTPLNMIADTLRGDGKRTGCMFLYRSLGPVSLLTKRL